MSLHISQQTKVKATDRHWVSAVCSFVATDFFHASELPNALCQPSGELCHRADQTGELACHVPFQPALFTDTLLHVCPTVEEQKQGKGQGQTTEGREWWKLLSLSTKKLLLKLYSLLDPLVYFCDSHKQRKCFHRNLYLRSQ